MPKPSIGKVFYFFQTINFFITPNEKYKDVWYWRAKSCDYDIILIGILPFSVIKRDQIITALNYSFEIKKLPGLKMTDEERSMRYEYYKKLRELKRV